MKVALLCSGYESIGLECISACLKKQGHQTSLVFDPGLFSSGSISNKFFQGLFSYKNTAVRRIIDLNPELIAVSVISDTYGWACETAKEIKKHIDVPVIFGGIHPTSVPDRVIQEDFVDYVCVGEGEEAVLELLNALEQGKDTTNIRNIWAKKDGKVVKNPLRPLVSDLDSLPFPDKELFYKEYPRYKDTYSIVSARGCIYDCSFCCHSFLKNMYQENGPYYRRRSVGNVIEELRQAKKKHGIKNIFFCDDLFLYDKDWLRHFCQEYKKFIALPFACEAHPAHVDDEMAELIDSAGCVTVGMGVESLDEKVKQNMLHRYEKNSQVIAAIESFRKTNIFLCADILVSATLQDEGSLMDTARFFNKHRPDFVFPFWLRYYPGMEILNLAEQKGILSSADIKEIHDSKNFSPFRGNTFSKKTGRITNLVMVSHLLPQGLLEAIIKSKFYRCFLAGSVFTFHLVAMFTIMKKKLFSGKKRLVLSTVNQLRFYMHYMGNKILRI